MGAGWGVDATVANGVATSGTTAQDVRQVWGALYTPGVINGASVSTTSSGWFYNVAAGVVAIRTAVGEVVLAPVPNVSVPTVAAPASGSRTDIIYARQKFPTTDNSSDVVVERGTTLPARSVELGRFIVSAGSSSTISAVRTGAVDYSIPYGASLGILHYWQDKQSKALPTTYLPATRDGYGTFYLPTDRQVSLKYTNIVSANNAGRFDDAAYCEYGFFPNVDGTDVVMWATPGLHQAWQSIHYEQIVNLSAGKHTVNIGVGRIVGPGVGRQWYGDYRPGAQFTVRDEGPVK